MLLLNIRQNCGHVNGTRYIVHSMTKNFLFLRAVSGNCKGSSILLPRLNRIPGKDDFPIPGFRRCQFPVRVCFAMTINKAQGQSVPGKLGLDLCSPFFAHGQLYVALSRTTHPRNVYVCTGNGQKKTKNVLYPEVLTVNATKVAQCVMSSKQSVDVVSELQFEEILARISIPHALGESDVLELDEHCETGSEIDHAWLSHIDGSEAIDSLEKIVVRESIDWTSINENNAKLHHQKIFLSDMNHKRSSAFRPKRSEFWGFLRKIPDRVSSSRVTVSKRDLASVICPRAWVTDSPITAFMMLFNQGNIVTFDTAFVTILRSIVQSNTTGIYTDFLEQFFGRRFHGVL